MSTSQQQAPLLTVDQAAERLAVHPHTVRRLIHQGVLPAVRLGVGRRPLVRVDVRDLDALAEPFPQADRS
jgi:excisionase family DNA binding protein